MYNKYKKKANSSEMMKRMNGIVGEFFFSLWKLRNLVGLSGNLEVHKKKDMGTGEEWLWVVIWKDGVRLRVIRI
jgi:hypothetical protein